MPLTATSHRRSLWLAAIAVLGSVSVVTPVGAAHGATSSARGMQVTAFETGGRVEQGYSSSRLPVVHMHEGKLYTPAVRADEVPRVRARAVNAAELQLRVNALYDAAVTPAGGFGTLPFDSVTTMRIVVTTERGTRSVTVHGFEYQPGLDHLVGVEAGTARKQLYEALNQITALSGRTTAYSASRVELWDQPGKPGLIPVKLRTAPTPSATPTCSTLKASAVPSGTARSSAFQLPNKKMFQAFVRPVLPGETPCTRP
jgi:hypothetical protein